MWASNEMYLIQRKKNKRLVICVKKMFACLSHNVMTDVYVWKVGVRMTHEHHFGKNLIIINGSNSIGMVYKNINITCIIEMDEIWGKKFNLSIIQNMNFMMRLCFFSLWSSSNIEHDEDFFLFTDWPIDRTI